LENYAKIEKPEISFSIAQLKMKVKLKIEWPNSMGSRPLRFVEQENSEKGLKKLILTGESEYDIHMLISYTRSLIPEKEGSHGDNPNNHIHPGRDKSMVRELQ
jgi:hypothetical protein